MENPIEILNEAIVAAKTYLQKAENIESDYDGLNYHQIKDIVDQSHEITKLTEKCEEKLRKKRRLNDTITNLHTERIDDITETFANDFHSFQTDIEGFDEKKVQSLAECIKIQALLDIQYIIEDSSTF